LSEEIQSNWATKRVAIGQVWTQACREEGIEAAREACEGERVHNVLLLLSVYSELL